jgi:hypothetical protein
VRLAAHASPPPGERLFDCRDAVGRGVVLRVSRDGARRAEIEMAGRGPGAADVVHASDAGAAAAGAQVAVVVDGGPRLVSWVVNGRFGDGGADRVFGYAHYESVGNVRGAATCEVGASVQRLRVYERALRTAELRENYFCDASTEERA